MRTRIFFLAAATTSIAAAIVAQGCGETETTEATSDAGSDVVDAGRRDAPVFEDEDAATCDTSADFTNDIPDASIADGASTTGICVGCAKDHCKKYIDDCNVNCQCQGLAAQALECYAKTGGDIVGCLGQFANAKPSKQTQQTGTGLFSCIESNCEEECQTEALNPDGGEPSDAGTDGDAS